MNLKAVPVLYVCICMYGKTKCSAQCLYGVRERKKKKNQKTKNAFLCCLLSGMNAMSIERRRDGRDIYYRISMGMG